jgi:hypothetical protein
MMKKQFLAVAALLVLVVSPTIVMADQCAYVSEKQANAAALYLPAGGAFVPFCEPCGDKPFPVGASVTAATSSVNPLPTSATGLDQNFWELQLNGEGVDLAYIYVKQPNGTFINLAKLAHCPTSGVKTAYDAKGRVLKLRGLPRLPR